MEHVVEGVVHVFEDDDDVGNFGDDAHEEDDVRVTEDALHDDFVLDFVEEVVSETRVEYFFDGYCSAI